ncbi:hypothetical protein [Saccharopolyspora sp. 5N708]|uniref:hypothetical protein n=1 Tax=Saccharopolyspora sp. 5N708 TaxID=3457424 RepID=UPI003FD4A3B1
MSRHDIGDVLSASDVMRAHVIAPASTNESDVNLEIAPNLTFEVRELPVHQHLEPREVRVREVHLLDVLRKALPLPTEHRGEEILDKALECAASPPRLLLWL